jgi:hypothetical protein
MENSAWNHIGTASTCRTLLVRKQDDLQAVAEHAPIQAHQGEFKGNLLAEVRPQ